MKLIDQDALVAEIRERLKSTYSDDENIHHVARYNLLVDILAFLDTLEVKEVDLEKEKEKLNKAIKLADAMYNAAQQLTTDASRLHKAMQDWWYFKNIEL